VQGDRVAPDRPFGDAEVGRGGATVDDRAALEQLEEGEQSGGRTRDAWIEAWLRTKTVLNRF